MSARRKFLAGMLAAALAAALAPPTASAFRLDPWWVRFPTEAPPDIPPHVPPRIGANAQMVHWDLREFPNCQVPWCFGGRFSTDLPPGDQISAISAAFDAWEAVEPARIAFRQTASGPGRAGVFDRYNTVEWTDSLPNGLIGMTVYWANRSSGHLIEADILFNDGDYTFVQDPPEGTPRVKGHYGVKQVAMHEIGHFIGLGHTDNIGPDLDVFPFGDFPGPEDVDDNDDGILNRNIMYAYDDGFNHALIQKDDANGCNFLYDVDLGDAPDPYSGTFNRYPSLVHGAPSPVTLNGITLLSPGKGAEHIYGIRPRQRDYNYLYEWLGYPFAGTDDADGECEANVPDEDAFDDGLELTPNPPICGKPFELRSWVRYATDDDENHHWYAESDSGGPMIVRTWLDFNRDAHWESSEIVNHDRVSPPELPPIPNVTAFTSSSGFATLPIIGPDPPWYWIRDRLDWVEDDAPNWDGTLNGPEGAAAFGEVEDYPIRCQLPKRQHVLRNNSGAPAQAVGLVVPGHATLGEHYEAFVSAGDCLLAPFQGATIAVWDPLSDETTVTFSDPVGIPPGATVHVGIGSSGSSSTQALRAFWVPQGGPAPAGVTTASTPVPTTNAMVRPLHDVHGAPIAEVVLGATNAAVGGVIAGDPATVTWDDSIHVDVIARVATTPFSLAALSECNAQLTQLPAIPLGGAWITPDRPLRAIVPQDLAGKSLVLEVTSSWTRNAGTSLELLQLERPTDALAVEGPATPRPMAAGLSLSVTPNPAARLVAARFALASAQRVMLRVYDVRGALVRTLVGGEWLRAGETTRLWDGLDGGGRLVPAGAYFVRLDAGELSESRIAILRR